MGSLLNEPAGVMNGNIIDTVYVKAKTALEIEAILATPYLEANVLMLYFLSPSISGKSFVTAITPANTVINEDIKVTTGFHLNGMYKASRTA